MTVSHGKVGITGFGVRVESVASQTAVSIRLERLEKRHRVKAIL